ncbi:hypothetical protein [Streptosporangium minutum]|uniref:Uncharacterized protein n=1 Tax=Streptosporangium minutum TaxID=569862 RepID=A0A243RUI1_9ACTN|nr:hypothetical protein [Streptosporangium minutum]OUC98063.1 hypothetical protein CA984_08395 [Streptosporangium minutum]
MCRSRHISGGHHLGRLLVVLTSGGGDAGLPLDAPEMIARVGPVVRPALRRCPEAGSRAGTAPPDVLGRIP